MLAIFALVVMHQIGADLEHGDILVFVLVLRVDLGGLLILIVADGVVDTCRQIEYVSNYNLAEAQELAKEGYGYVVAGLVVPQGPGDVKVGWRGRWTVGEAEVGLVRDNELLEIRAGGKVPCEILFREISVNC